MTAYGDILWRPSVERLEQSCMGRFAAAMSAATGRDLRAFPDLHRWSVDEPAAFWAAVAAEGGVKFSTPPDRVVVPPPPGRMRGGAFFAGARLNFAEHLLAGSADREALVALAEGAPRRVLTLADLRSEVARCAAALARCGVGPGDRVCGVIANVPEAVVAMLATAALGGVWASCSPDFGPAAVVDRLGQIAPKVLFFTDAYVYGGKAFSCAAAWRETLARLPGEPQAVLVSHLGAPAAGGGPRAMSWTAFVGTDAAPPLRYVARRFDDPLYVMFSSGTTGPPKCIVHGVGGTLVQHLKELRLHSDVAAGSRLLFYTTCGWMMWNWMASGLAAGATLVLYEGSVASPDLGALWRAVGDERVTALGTSPKFVATCMAHGVRPREHLGGHAPRTLLSTGAPLMPAQFAWLYREAAPPGGDLHLASISGGTDIISCFMLGTPLLPVRAGEIQYAGLGMDIAAWDEAGASVLGAKGELVCRRPFPSMPLGFWDDPAGERYGRAYFERAPAAGGAQGAAGGEVWHHGDFVELTPHGGVIVYGRSDATLNPGGIRIGTAELYRQVEALPEVVDALAVARRQGGDEHIVLFVKLAPGRTLDAALTQRIKGAIRSGLTPRHVPQAVLQVADIPYTRSGKKVELAVTQAIHGEPVANLAALANPEAMAEYVAMGRAGLP